MTGSRLAVAAIGWVASVVLIRTLSIDQFAAYSVIFALFGLLSIITDMGVGRVAIRAFMEGQENQSNRAGAYIALRAMLGLLGYLIGVTAVAAMSLPAPATTAAVVAGTVIVIDTIASAHGILFEARSQLHLPATASLVAAALQLAGVVAIAAAGGGLVAFMIPVVLGGAVRAGIIVSEARRRFPIRYQIDHAYWKHLLREAVPISLGAAMATLTYKVDLLMLAKLSTSWDVAQYGVAYKFVDILAILPWVATTATLPLLIAAWPHDTEAFRAALASTYRILMSMASLSAVGFALLADDVIPLVFGEKYQGSAPPAVLLFTASAVGFAGAIALMALIAAGRHRAYPWLSGAVLIFNVLANLVAIPRMGIMGAAWVTMLTTVLSSVGLWILVWRQAIPRPIAASEVWRLPACSGFALLCGHFSQTRSPWPVVGAVVIVAFLVSVQVTRAVGPDSLLQLASRFSRGAPSA